MTAIPDVFSGAVVHHVGWTLVHFLWQGMAVGAVLGVLLPALRRRSASVRYLAACTTLGIMVVLPAVTLWFLRTPAPTGVSGVTTILPTRGWTTSSSIGGNEGIVNVAPRTPVARPVVPWSEQIRIMTEDSLPFLVAGWFAGVVILSIRLLSGWLLARRLRQVGNHPVGERWRKSLLAYAERLGISRPVQLMESALVQVPMVIGHLRPVILLPVSALTGLSPAQLEAIIVHELAHIRRWDYLVNLIQSVAETLLFYHPAVWWVSRRIRQEREHCCDDLAVSVCGDRFAYARALVAMEELRQPPLRLAVAAHGGSLLGRIRRLLESPAPKSKSPRYLAGIIILALCAGLMGAIQVSVSLASRPPAEGKDVSSKATSPAISAGRDLVPVQVNDKWGFADGTYRLVIPARFDRTIGFQEGLAPVQVGQKWGYIDEQGQMVIRPQFSASYPFSEGLAAVYINQQVGYIDRKGRIVIPPQFGYGGEFRNGLAWVHVRDKKNGKYGLIDRTGLYRIPPMYDSAFYHHDGPVCVQRDNKYGYFDVQGRIILDLRYDKACRFSEGLAQVRLGSKRGYIDPAGRFVFEIPQYLDGEEFSEGLARTYVNKKWGFIDRTGKIAIQPQFDQKPGTFSEGLAVIAVGGPPEAPLAEDEVRYWWADAPKGRRGYIDRTGRVVIAPQFESAAEFSHGLARVTLAGRTAYIDKTGKVIYPNPSTASQPASRPVLTGALGGPRERTTAIAEPGIGRWVEEFLSALALGQKSEVSGRIRTNAPARARFGRLLTLSRQLAKLKHFDLYLNPSGRGVGVAITDEFSDGKEQGKVLMVTLQVSADTRTIEDLAVVSPAQARREAERKVDRATVARCPVNESFPLPPGMPKQERAARTYQIMDLVDSPLTGLPGRSDTVTVDTLIERIKTTVADRNEWASKSRIEVWQDYWLMIYTTPANHVAIAKMLDDLRREQGVEVSLDTQFVTVSAADADVLLRQTHSRPGHQVGQATSVGTDEDVKAFLAKAATLKSTTIVQDPRLVVGNNRECSLVLQDNLAPKGTTPFAGKDIAYSLRLPRVDKVLRGEPSELQFNLGQALDAKAKVSPDNRTIQVAFDVRASYLITKSPPPHIAEAHGAIQTVVPDNQTLIIPIPFMRSRVLGARASVSLPSGKREFEMVSELLPGPAISAGTTLFLVAKPRIILRREAGGSLPLAAKRNVPSEVIETKPCLLWSVDASPAIPAPPPDPSKPYWMPYLASPDRSGPDVTLLRPQVPEWNRKHDMKPATSTGPANSLIVEARFAFVAAADYPAFLRKLNRKPGTVWGGRFEFPLPKDGEPCITIPSELAEHFVRGLQGVKSSLIAQCPRVMVRSGMFEIHQFGPSEDEPLVVLPQEGRPQSKAAFRMAEGTAVALRADLVPERKSVSLDLETRWLTRCDEQGPPEQAEAYWAGKVTIPLQETLLVELPFREYRLIACREIPTPMGEEKQVEILKSPIQTLRKRGHVFLLVKAEVKARSGKA